jgi:hypothetical protein
MYNVTYTLRTLKINSMKNRWQRRPIVLKNMLNDPWEAKYYVGWRGKIRALKGKWRRLIRGM